MRSPPRLSKDSQQYTLQDVWYALSHHEVFDYAFWLDVTMQILFTRCVSSFGWTLVVMVVFLVGILSYVGFFVALPRIAAPYSFVSCVHIILGLFVLFNIYFNYFFAVTVSPGHPTDKDQMDSSFLGGVATEVKSLEEGNGGHHAIRSMSGGNNFLKECKKCNKVKPPRAHHCSICKKCVLKMDHHCPYVANCVGYYNYRYFFLFLLWTTIGTFYLSVVCGFAGFVDVGDAMQNNMVVGNSKFDAVPLARERNRSRVVGRLRRGRNGSGNEGRLEMKSGEEVEEGHRLQSGSTTPLDLQSTPDMEVPVSTSIHYRFSSMIGTNFMSSTLTRLFLARTNADMWELIYVADSQIFLALITSSCVFVAVGCLFAFHVALVRSGQTTIEYYKSWTTKQKLVKSGRVHKNEYDRGLNKNIGSVLGNLPWYRAILPSHRRPPPLVVSYESPTLFTWQQRLLQEQNTS